MGWKCVTDRSLMCYALFILLQPHTVTIATTTRNAFTAAQFCLQRIGPYIKPVCDFHHLLCTQSAWKYQNLLNSMTQKCTKEIDPFLIAADICTLLTNDNHLAFPLARCVGLWRQQWLRTLQGGGKTSRENHFDSQSSPYSEVQCSTGLPNGPRN